MRSCASACALLLLLGGCGSSATAGERAPESDAGAGHVAPTDDDGDGLCDLTEQEFGTDPQAIDTDGDSLPDLIELVHGLDATDPVNPLPDQLAYLEARQDSSLEFAVRATVHGEGQGFSGYFQALAAVYADGLSAADFFAGANAVAAHPADAVRGIDQGSAHFAAVLGKTRLAFSLRFTYPWDEIGAVDCARAYPFRYAIKTDDGETRAERLYLLMVVPEGSTGGGEDHCLPHSCQ